MRHHAPDMTSQQPLRTRNLRLGLILASIAATFFIGFVAKLVWLGPH